MRHGRRSRRVGLLRATAVVAALASGVLGSSSITSAGAQELRDASEAAAIPGSYIVVYKRSIDSPRAETKQRQRQLGFERDYLYRHSVEGFAADLSAQQVQSLESDPEVDFVSENRRVQATGDLDAEANAPLAPGEPVPPTGVRRILAGSDTTVREPGANTAVIDTGIQLDHPDLNAVAGTDCIDPGTPPDDGAGHGTHVSGTIGAKNNGSGVTGVAPDTKLYAVRVLDDSGSGTDASVICGIDWVTANQAMENIQVANMSLGGTGAAQGSETCATTTDPMRAAICRSTDAGVRYVVAAGNSSWDFDFPPQPDTPAAYPEVLTVTAIADSDGAAGGAGPSTSCGSPVADDTPAPFSNYALTAAGKAHTIAAPGVCINSTVPGSAWNSNYSGTSMASPHAAGVVALCVSEAGADGPCASLTPAQTIDRVRADAQTYSTEDSDYGFTGDPISTPGSEYYGFLTVASDPPTDDIPPSAFGLISPADGAAVNSRPSLSWGASSDSGSGLGRYEVWIDGAIFATVSRDATTYEFLSNLVAGPHTWQIRAIDAAGNARASASQAFTVDTQAPNTTITSGPSGPTNNNSPSFAFSSSEPNSSFECRLSSGFSSGSWSSCSSPNSYSNLPDGPHTFEVRATDAANNTDPTPASRGFIVDTAPPETTIDSGPSDRTNSNSPSFTFSSSEPNSSFLSNSPTFLDT